MKFFKTTLNNHLYALRFHLFGTLLQVTLLIYFQISNEGFDIAIIIFAVWVGLSIPVAIAHIQYYFQNYEMKLMIGSSGIIVEYKTGDRIEISSDEIRNIVLCKSASLDKGGMPLTGVEAYHYAEIQTKNRGNIFITCLLIQDVETEIRNIKSVNIIRKRRIFLRRN